LISAEPDLIQSHFDGDEHQGWKVLIACMSLNLTRREQAEPVLAALFKMFPTPEAMAGARRVVLEEMMKPLGLWKCRAKRAKRLSQDWIRFRDGEIGLDEIHGVGLYAIDSYNYFVLDDTSKFRSGDVKLRAWREWKGLETDARSAAAGR
jgi:adenine-specific DNA glycosylase